MIPYCRGHQTTIRHCSAHNGICGPRHSHHRRQSGLYWSISHFSYKWRI